MLANSYTADKNKQGKKVMLLSKVKGLNEEKLQKQRKQQYSRTSTLCSGVSKDKGPDDFTKAEDDGPS